MLSLVTFALAASQASARPTTSSVHVSHDSNACTNGKAIYMISNNKANAVVALPIAQDGTLSVAGGTVTTTGGAGANGITQATNQSAGPDALFSQQALTIAGNSLFAVNAGSNTVTMFTIDARDPTKLSIVGSPAAVPGDFPVTVAASSDNNLVCVGTSGARSGISCGQFSAGSGIGPLDSLRPFNLGQTTPPGGPFNTISQVFFSDDQSTLFSTVKGNPAVNNTGFLAAFPVKNTRSSCETVAVDTEPIMTSPNGTAVLFGSEPIPESNNLFVVDASFGAVVLGINKNPSPGHPGAVVLGKGVIPGQKAACWTAISPATNTAFVADAGLDRLIEMSLTDASIQGQPIDLNNGDPGLTDLRAAGSFIYALSPGNGTTDATVTVVNVVARKQVQHVQLTNLGLNKNAQGMAILV